MCYEDFEFYEQSEREVVFDEIKDKLIECLPQEIKDELNNLKNENKTLKAKNDKLSNELSKLEREKANANWETDKIRKEVENEFYRKTIIEVFERLLEDSEVWYAACVPHEKPKCDLCNEERQMVATYPNGKTVKMECDCARKTYAYEPMLSLNRGIKFHKALNPRYDSKKKVYFTKSYSPNSNHVDAYDCYGEFRIERIYDDFNEDVKTYHKEKRYDDKIAFRNEEACQKYCDWLNEQNKEK